MAWCVDGSSAVARTVAVLGRQVELGCCARRRGRISRWSSAAPMVLQSIIPVPTSHAEDASVKSAKAGRIRRRYRSAVTHSAPYAEPWRLCRRMQKGPAGHG